MSLRSFLNRINYLLGTFALISLAGIVSAQTGPSLNIVSPTSGTPVTPGQTVKVIVTATNPSLLKSETIAGPVQLIPSLFLPQQTPGAQLTFSLIVPNPASDGAFYISAVGGLPGGGVVVSNAVQLIVPVAAPVSALRVSNSPLVFLAPGKALNLDVSVITNGNRFTPNVTSLAYSSANPNVASVNADGTVTAMSIGQTNITVTLGVGGSAVSSVVPVTVKSAIRGDLNGDGRVDIDDVHILQKWLNTPANGPNDARDLNHDGVINALDARILVTLCTHPGCAYQ